MRKLAGIFVVLNTLILSLPTLAQDGERTQFRTPVVMQGVFYNTRVRSGGTVTIQNFEQQKGSGYINFTQRPENPNPLCGAGNFSGSSRNKTITATFVSNDIDPGCGFDRNAVFSLNGTVNGTSFWGNYSGKNTNGSRFVEAGGVFEAIAGQLPKRQIYIGTFKNNSSNAGGSVIIEMLVGQNTVSGFINFTNQPSQQPLCGAGEFTGVRRPNNTIELSFISNDPDQNCGFDKGLQFLIDAQLSNNQTALTGNYKVNNSPSGSFRAELAR